jgi:hypothetical protein
LYRNGKIALKSTPMVGNNEELTVPNNFMKKAAELYLNIDSPLPDNFYTIPDFKYVITDDAFLYQPFSPKNS